MIHRALKLLRGYHNIKQKELASQLGVSASHLSEIESGAKPVSYSLLEQYSRIFKIPVSSITLFAEASESKDKTRVAALVADKALKLLEWLDAITEVKDEERIA